MFVFANLKRIRNQTLFIPLGWPLHWSKTNIIINSTFPWWPSRTSIDSAQSIRQQFCSYNACHQILICDRSHKRRQKSSLLYYYIMYIYIFVLVVFVVQIAGVLITWPQPKLKEHLTFFELECSVRFTNDNFQTAILFLKSTIDLYSPQVTPTDTYRWAINFLQTLFIQTPLNSPNWTYAKSTKYQNSETQ